MVLIGLGTTHGSWHPLGVWEHICQGCRGPLYTLLEACMEERKKLSALYRTGRSEAHLFPWREASSFPLRLSLEYGIFMLCLKTWLCLCQQLSWRQDMGCPEVSCHACRDSGQGPPPPASISASLDLAHCAAHTHNPQEETISLRNGIKHKPARYPFCANGRYSLLESFCFSKTMDNVAVILHGLLWITVKDRRKRKTHMSLKSQKSGAKRNFNEYGVWKF